MNEHKETGVRITPQAVRAQVDRIVASEGFVRSPRMQRFLAFIVEETLGGRADQLGEYGIGVTVYDRGQGFEPALDPIVRNDARRLRLKLLEYYRQAPPDSVLIEVPKGAYVPVFLPVASREKSAAPGLTRRLGVLPFDVLSAAPESTSDSRALCMSLTANLTNLDGLEVVAHGYLREAPIREAASELRLSHAIHGTVLKSSGRRRVIVNLIHIPDGAQLWAHEYDFESGEMLTFQSEITGAVVREVTARLGLRRQQSTHLAIAA